MFAKGLQSRGMTSTTFPFPVELRAETPTDAAFVDGLVRGHLAEALGLSPPPGFDPAPLLEMQARSREAMLAGRFPDLKRRVAWIGEERTAMLLTGTLDGALHVVEIIIAPTWRRRGVGAAILAQVVADGRTRERDVTASIFVTNTASLGLFSSVGFALDLAPGAVQATAILRTGINVTRDVDRPPPICHG